MMVRFPISGGEGLAHVQISAAACIVMKTTILPDGKIAAGDNVDGITSYVDYTPSSALNAVLRVGNSKRAQVGHSS